MLVYSETLRHWYDDGDKVFFKNIKQSIAYIDWGARVWDVFTSGDGKLTFCFSREDHLKYRDIWGTKENNQVENFKKDDLST